MTLWRPQPPPPPNTGEWKYIATDVATSTPDGVIGEWVDGLPTAEVRAAASEFAARSRGAFREGRHMETGCAYLRLRVKHVPPERVEGLGRPLAGDVDFVPSSAPADYPRVPLVDLLEFAAASTA